MDLAQSILKELITLQKKNEELARIITQLEHESDIIIQQFEHKIEELQKILKHEQDDKARAARRYDEEIRDLEGSKAALIHETAEVRETYQTRINQLETEIRSLSSAVDTKEKEFLSLSSEKERIIAVFTEDLNTLQGSFTSYKNETEKERADLSTRLQVLTDALERERRDFSEIIVLKDRAILQTQDSLHLANEDLQELLRREKSFKEKTRRTIDNLHDLVQAERQVRKRELKERDDRIIILEEERDEGLRSLTELRNHITIEKEQFDRELSDLNHTVSKSLTQKSLLEEKISNLTSQLGKQAQEFEDELKKRKETYLSEKETLEQSLSALDQKLRSSLAFHQEAIHKKDAQLSSQLQKMNSSEAKYEAKLREWEEITSRLSEKISSLDTENADLTDRVHKAELENSRLQGIIKRTGDSYDEERRALQGEIAEHQMRSAETEKNLQKEISALREHLSGLMVERDQVVSEKLESEEYYRGEITRLHEEISVGKNDSKEKESSLINDIADRDSRITTLSINNESLRSELERIRYQLGKLHETIRAEKEESVHALYREITSLEEKIAGKNAELLSLSNRLIRLDAENTRLLQELSEKTSESVLSMQKNADIRSDSPTLSAQVSHPGKREIAGLVADLEDPSRAAAAAESLKALGNDIVDHLIPLLHTGSIQRRVWVAVILYELNDNRATLPLMKLLETPTVHFRELIWEAKKQFHSRIRAGSPAKPAGLRIGSGGPGSI